MVLWLQQLSECISICIFAVKINFSSTDQSLQEVRAEPVAWSRAKFQSSWNSVDYLYWVCWPRSICYWCFKKKISHLQQPVILTGDFLMLCPIRAPSPVKHKLNGGDRKLKTPPESWPELLGYTFFVRMTPETLQILILGGGKKKSAILPSYPPFLLFSSNCPPFLNSVFSHWKQLLPSQDQV